MDLSYWSKKTVWVVKGSIKSRDRQGLVEIQDPFDPVNKLDRDFLL